MKTIKDTFPIFEKDQVLTASHLNDLRTYLDRQDRMSRALLVGVGVACGLEVDFAGEAPLTITGGVGVTSRGYLVSMPEAACTHIREYQPVRSGGEGRYEPFFADDDTEIPLWELLTADEERDLTEVESHKMVRHEETLSLEGDAATVDFSSHHVLLFLEIEDVDTDDCVGDDCDEEGIRREFRLRKLLFPTEQLSEVWKSSAPGAVARDPMGACAALPDPCVERLGYYPDESAASEGLLNDLSLENYVRFGQLRNDYEQIIRRSSGRIGRALKKAYEAFKPVLENRYPENPFGDFGEGEENGVDNPLYRRLSDYIDENPYLVQYAYDFVKDLADAYEEFREAACEVLTVCRPDPGAFERHLLLGPAEPLGSGERVTRRHFFRPSPIHGPCGEKREKALLLFERAVRMRKAFDPAGATDSGIRITPDRSPDTPLSRRSIPYYYNVEKHRELVRAWNYEKARLSKSNRIPSYHAGSYNSSDGECHPVEAHLHAGNRYDQLRVEGHIGKKYDEALAHIDGQRKKYNLPFKVVGVKLSSRFGDTDLSVECRFDDLENLYRATVADLRCLLEEQVEYFNKVAQQKREPQGDAPMVMIYWYRLPEEILAGKIEDFKEKLPERLEDLDIREVEGTYKALMESAKEYRDTLEGDEGPPAETHREQIILYRLGKLIHGCSVTRLKKLHQLYQERVKEAQKMNRFSDFASRHSGLEHMAGVPRGGTLVLVYIDRNEKRFPWFFGEIEPAAGITHANLPLVHTEFPGSGGTGGEGGSESEGGSGGGLPRPGSGEVPPHLLGMLGDIASERNIEIDPNILGELERGMEERLTPPARIDPSELTSDRVVVADFALPYLCRSDCPELATMIISQVGFSLADNRFCADDEAKYPFVTDPAGGVVESTGGGVFKEGGTWYFRPSDSEPEGEKIRFTYRVNNQTVVYEARVFNPTAAFSFDTQQMNDGSVKVRFTNGSQGAESYEWDFGDGSDSAKPNPEHIYKDFEEEEAVVTLVARKQGCSDSISRVVEIPQQMETEFSLRTPKEWDEMNYCNTDERAYLFTAVPTGGEITGDDTSGVKEQNGRYLFVPKDYEPGSYTFGYRDKSIEIKILQGPQEADFDVEIIEQLPGRTRARIHYTGQAEVKKLRWIIDGETYDEVDTPEHTFRAADGTHRVMLHVTTENGCTASIDRPVEIPFRREDDNGDGDNGGGGLLDFLDSDFLNTGGGNLVTALDNFRDPQLDNMLFGGSNPVINPTRNFMMDLGVKLQDEDNRRAFLAGGMNREIGNEFQPMLERSFRIIMQKAAQAGPREKNYLAGMYEQQAGRFLDLASSQNKDIRGNSNMGGVLKRMAVQIREMNERGLDLGARTNLGSTLKAAMRRARRNDKEQYFNLLRQVARTLLR